MTLIFGVVFLILAKFGFPVITGMVRSRRDHIAASLRDAEEARRQLACVEESCRKLMAEARMEQDRLLEQARQSARQIVEDARQQASSEASLIIAKAKDEIEAQKQESLTELKNTVAGFSIAVSSRILRDELSSDDAQKAYVSRLVDEVGQELS